MILKRNPSQLPKKLERLKHEVRTQPISTAITIAVFAFVLSKCVSPDAGATPVIQTIEAQALEKTITDSSTILNGPKGKEPVEVDFSYMGKGSKVGPMMGAYFGMSATKDRPAFVPDSATVNWADNVQMLWNKKLKFKNVTPSTVKNAHLIVDGYANSPRDTKSLRQFVDQVDVIVDETHTSINYTTLCKSMKIADDKCGSFKKTMGRIQGKHIVAYGMTEIFPAHNGKYNLIALDTLLRNAGENYIDAIPALGDKLLSRGLYQFTSYAVRRDDHLVGGANFVDNHAGMKLPGSVLYLEGRNSHKAAFEFATYNIGMLVRKLDDKGVKTLATKCSTEQLDEYIATSHHMPARAVKNAVSWVKGGCVKSYRSYTGEHLGEYAKKTSLNYTALNEFLK
jgi:hypothetical protein